MLIVHVSQLTGVYIVVPCEFHFYGFYCWFFRFIILLLGPSLHSIFIIFHIIIFITIKRHLLRLVLSLPCFDSFENALIVNIFNFPVLLKHPFLLSF